MKLPYWSAPGQPEGGVLIVYGDAPVYGLQDVEVLAKKLAQVGWSTALIQAENGSKDNKWVEQIPQALAALRLKDNNRLVVLHYGDKLHEMLNYFSKPQSKQVTGFIFLSAYDRTSQKDMPDLLVKLSFPKFDINGQFDYESVLKQAKSRRLACAQDKHYQAVVLPGARHQYWFTANLLIAYLQGWMLKLPNNQPAKPPIDI